VSLEVPGGPPHGGPPFVLDPGGRIRTGISLMDSESLYQLRYPGVVPKMYARQVASAIRTSGHVSCGRAFGRKAGRAGGLSSAS
jgi:hypothetical protein